MLQNKKHETDILSIIYLHLKLIVARLWVTTNYFQEIVINVFK